MPFQILPNNVRATVKDGSNAVDKRFDFMISRFEITEMAVEQCK